MNGRKKMRSKVSLLCLPAIIKFKLNIKFRLSILGGRINYDYPGSVKLISYNFSVIFIFSSFEGEYSVGNIFFSWTNQSRVLRNIGKREIVDGYKNRKGNVFVRENNYTPKIGKRRMSNREFLPLPALLYHSFRRFPTGPRSRSTIDRCRFSFFFFFDEIIRIIILILSRKLWTEKDRLLLSTVFVEKKNFLEMRYLYNFFNYSFELE